MLTNRIIVVAITLVLTLGIVLGVVSCSIIGNDSPKIISINGNEALTTRSLGTQVVRIDFFPDVVVGDTVSVEYDSVKKSYYVTGILKGPEGD
jgi:hypothetical protein